MISKQFKSRAVSSVVAIAVYLLMVGICSAPLYAAPLTVRAPSPLPDSAAARQMAGFLAAFNSGSRATLHRFIDDNFEKPKGAVSFADDSTDQYLRTYQQSHGYTIREITAAASASITALVQARSTGTWMELTVFVTALPPDYVTAAPPFHIVGLGISDIRTPPAFLQDHRLSDLQIRANADSLLDALAADDAFSGVVYVARDGKAIYSRAVGLASKAWGVPNRIDTRFNLASITKMFTAVAIAQLVEQGRLSYTDTVGKVLPNYPNRAVAQQVTVHDLLSHTSGMIGGRDLAEKTVRSTTARSIDAMLPAFVDEPLSFRPGQQYDYSNAGYILLGKIIERMSGQSYYDYVRQHIFRPAGMSHTGFDEVDADSPNLATGYEDAPNGIRRSNVLDLDVKGSPAGMACSTAEDMVRFHMALIRHRLLTARSVETLWAGVTEQPDRNNTEYGYGAQISSYNGARIVGHGGGWKGVTDEFEMYPELGYTVVVLSNYDDDPAAVANKLCEWLTQGRHAVVASSPAPPALTVTAVLSSVVVRTGEPVTITVTVRNRGGTAHATLIDMEVKDSHGAKTSQQFTAGQRIETGQARSYAYTWTPSTSGVYTVDLGAFGPNWTPSYAWVGHCATVSVQ